MYLWAFTQFPDPLGLFHLLLHLFLRNQPGLLDLLQFLHGFLELGLLLLLPIPLCPAEVHPYIVIFCSLADLLMEGGCRIDP